MTNKPQVGDEVYVTPRWHPATISKIARITPTGRIIVGSTTYVPDKFGPTGQYRAQGGNSMAYWPVADEMRARIERGKQRSKAMMAIAHLNRREKDLTDADRATLIKMASEYQ